MRSSYHYESIIEVIIVERLKIYIPKAVPTQVSQKQYSSIERY